MLLAGAASGDEGSAEAGKAKSTTCAACHGQTGNSVAPNWPSLAGQNPSYIVRQLKAYKNGERQNAAMMGFASTLSEQDMRDLAAYFSSQSMIPKGADPKLVTRGQEIYRGGIAERGIPACIGCHGPSGHGNYLAAYPRIGGQNADYMLDALKAYADGRAVTSYVQGLQQGEL
jgi:cytochrome c553